MDLLYISKFHKYLVGDIRFDNVFVFLDTKPPAISVLHGWSGIRGQF